MLPPGPSAPARSGQPEAPWSDAEASALGPAIRLVRAGDDAGALASLRQVDPARLDAPVLRRHHAHLPGHALLRAGDVDGAITALEAGLADEGPCPLSLSLVQARVVGGESGAEWISVDVQSQARLCEALLDADVHWSRRVRACSRFYRTYRYWQKGDAENRPVPGAWDAARLSGVADRALQVLKEQFALTWSEALDEGHG